MIMENTNNSLWDLDIKIKGHSILFFDLDDTLVYTNFANYLAYEKAIQSVKKSQTPISYSPDLRFNRGYLKSLMPDLAQCEYEKIIQEKEDYFVQFLSETKLNRLIANIIIKHYKTNRVVLVTNCHKNRALMILNYYNLADKFGDLFCRQKTENESKINKYEKAISYFDLSPESIIVFENEKLEIDNAILAGIPAQNIINL